MTDVPPAIIFNKISLGKTSPKPISISSSILTVSPTHLGTSPIFYLNKEESPLFLLPSYPLNTTTMVEVFKTDVADPIQGSLLEYVLSGEFSDYKINFDLSDCDRILRIESSSINVDKVLSIVNGLGYRCQVLI